MHISSFMQVKSVFVDGLPPHWDEDRVRDHFKGYGEIERVVLARNMATAKRKDFGFVDFTTHEDAIACIEGVNNTELGDGKTKVLPQPPSLYIFIYLNISFFLNSDSIYHILIVFNAFFLCGCISCLLISLSCPFFKRIYTRFGSSYFENKILIHHTSCKHEILSLTLFLFRKPL